MIVVLYVWSEEGQNGIKVLFRDGLLKPTQDGNFRFVGELWGCGHHRPSTGLEAGLSG
jgi:hypothetical protein